MPAEHVTPIHDDEAWEDTVEHTSSGVKDILVTGKVCKAFSSLCSFIHSYLLQTSQRQGEAWGHFTILGRVSALWMESKDVINSSVRRRYEHGTDSVSSSVLLYV